MALTKVTSSLTDLDGGITIDNITIDGTTMTLSSGSMTIDVADNIVLDTDGGNIALKDNGTQWGNFANNGGNFDIDSVVQDKDIKFSGYQGSSYTERMRLTSTGDLKFNSGFGSVGAAYGVRAWVNFNGQGTVAIRGSGNVSSITDNGIGSYTINFTNAMPDTNYLTSGIGGLSTANLIAVSQPINNSGSIATGSVLVHVVYQNGTGFDASYVGVKIIR